MSEYCEDPEEGFDQKLQPSHILLGHPTYYRAFKYALAVIQYDFPEDETLHMDDFSYMLFLSSLPLVLEIT